MADTVGGTTITVEGEGFLDDPIFYCNFNGTNVPATFVSTREALCVAPAGGDERCEGTPLEVTVTANQFTKNGVPLRRVSSPQISRTYSARFASDLIDNSYGNVSGGEVVVLEGTGFQDSLYLACRFKSAVGNDAQYAYYADRDYSYSLGTQGVLYNNARFINATRVECVQPPFSSPTHGLGNVEITLDGTVWTTTGKPYQVVGVAQGLATFRLSTSGDWITGVVDSYTVDATVDIDPFRVFVIDSEQQRLRRLDQAARVLTINASNFVMQQISVAGNANSSLDLAAQCDPGTDIPVLGTPFLYTNGSSMTTTVNGYGEFDGWHINNPIAGTYTMTIADLSTGWTFAHSFIVRVGVPARLKICTQPPLYLDNLNPTLTTNPRLFVEDVVGNQLPAASLAGIKVEAVYLSEETITQSLTSDPRNVLGVPVSFNHTAKIEVRVGQLDDNFLKFEQLEMKGLHGSQYSITFTSAGLPNVTSNAIRVKPCNDNTNNSGALQYFSKFGTSECFLCPAGASCDGSTNIVLIQNNLWRPSNDSYAFYSCETPWSGDSCVVPNGSCIAGYRGPRCSVCQSGYGKEGNYCKPCRSQGAIVGFMMLLITITLLFVAVLVYASFTTPTHETLPILLKVAINHLQVASRVTEIVSFPSALTDLFMVFLQLSELIRFDIVSGECPPLSLTIYGRFYLAVSVPVFIIVLFGILYFGVFLYRKARDIGPKYTPVSISAQAKPPRRDRVMLTVAQFMAKLKGAAFQHHGDLSRDDLRPQYYTAWQYFSATTILVLVIVYPSVLQWCASMWKCDPIVYGDLSTLRTVSYLEIDRSIICTEHSHRVAQAIALAAALLYGLGVPVLCVAIVYSHWNTHGRAHTRRLYAYTTAGYDVTTWWWESVVMIRKAIIVFIIIFINDQVLRTYLAMWTMTLALGGHGWFQPFDPRRPLLYYLEGLGIVTLVVTLNLSLLFQFEQFSSNSTGFWVLVVFLFALNAFVIAIYVIFILIEVVKRIRRWATGKSEVLDETKVSETRRKSLGTGSFSRGSATSYDQDFTSFGQMDRYELQREGLLGALRRASQLKPKPKEELYKAPVATAAPKAGETPFERVQRLDAERKREEMRAEQLRIQAELEAELEELRDRMIRAQALAAAEESIISRHKELAEVRRAHEAELTRLMDEIRKERGEFVSKSDNQKQYQKELMQSIQFELDDSDEAGSDVDSKRLD